MEKLLIYVTVGTCHFKFNRMLSRVKACLENLDRDFDVILQYGSSVPVELPNCKKSEAFLSREESEHLYQQADLIFSHTGIGSLFNSLKYNRPTVLVARLEKYQEFSDDHQLQIAQEIVKNDLVYLLDNDNESVAPFLQFVDAKVGTDKKEVDLTNYKLAGFINDRLYAEG